MEHNLEDSIAILTRTPAVVDAFLRGLPETWTLRNEGANTMSPFDVIVHLIHAERTNWMPRARSILQYGESRAFEPFDRWGHIQESRGKPLENFLDEFSRVRADSLSELRALNLRQEDFDRRGTHPALGAVTMSQLLATWAVHDLTHLHQITRVMASQYRVAVGPSAKYLGVLHCDGHSAQS